MSLFSYDCLCFLNFHANILEGCFHLMKLQISKCSWPRTKKIFLVLRLVLISLIHNLAQKRSWELSLIKALMRVFFLFSYKCLRVFLGGGGVVWGFVSCRSGC